MGFPTANIEADASLDARDGVYASRVEVDGRMYDAMSNLGYKPTVDGRRRLLETNIFGFEGDLYGRRLRVELLRFIRPERRFGSVEELFRQIGDDRREVCGGGGEPPDPRGDGRRDRPDLPPRQAAAPGGPRARARRPRRHAPRWRRRCSS